MKFRLSIFILLLLLLQSCSQSAPPTPKNFIFGRSWALSGDSSPRGGTTTGKAVTPLKDPSAEWKALKETGLTKKEQDRRAILAMAGEYRTTFEFLETVAFKTNYQMDRPYHSWATEKVYVIEDKPNFISLQHIMVMYFIKDGEEIGPMVMKHWRQDWSYEPRSFHEYVGDKTWKERKLSSSEIRGRWVQEVFQVDDSPRYAAIGSWTHTNSFSSWESETTLRPLPRREYSVRSDYKVLEGINRQVILPTGWVHEQENFKRIDKANYISKEIGLNRYERIIDQDFTAGDQYWKRSQSYWKAVRDTWSEIYQERKSFTFSSKVDGRSLYEKHFRNVDTLSGAYDENEMQSLIESVIKDHIT